MRRANELTTLLYELCVNLEPQPPGTLRACPGIAVYSIKGHTNEELEQI
jgi:hypothetical protein